MRASHTSSTGAPYVRRGSTVRASSPEAARLPVERWTALISWLLPEAAEALRPRVDLAQRRRLDGVEPPGPLRPHDGEAVLPRDPQALGHGVP
ncbi:hypothetical protein ACFV3E_24015 [Streptomyces sp. NPDC059718]